jgi:hypothetical protein
MYVNKARSIIASLGLVTFIWAPSVTAQEAAPEATSTTTAAVADPVPIDSTIWVMTLVDGTQMIGRIQKEEHGKVHLLLLDGQTRTFFRADVGNQQEKSAAKMIKVVRGKIWDENPNRTRHLWSPSALPLREGEGYLSQKSLIFTSWAYGITDNVAILLGSVLPANFAGPKGANLIAALKVATKVAEKVHIGAGFETFIIPYAGTIGVGFASLTYGVPDAQVTINVGKPFAIDSSNAATGDFLVSVSAIWRFSRHYGLVSENIFIPGIDTDGVGWGIPSVHALVWRSIREETSWDFGFITPGGTGIAFPWFEWTWYLGN